MQKVQVTNKKLSDKAKEIIDLVIMKNHDYGDAWQRYGVFTPLIRINDKLLRVQTLINGETAMIADETIGDTLKDVVGYALLALLWLDSNKGANHTEPELDFIPKYNTQSFNDIVLDCDIDNEEFLKSILSAFGTDNEQKQLQELMDREYIIKDAKVVGWVATDASGKIVYVREYEEHDDKQEYKQLELPIIGESPLKKILVDGMILAQAAGMLGLELHEYELKNRFDITKLNPDVSADADAFTKMRTEELQKFVSELGCPVEFMIQDPCDLVDPDDDEEEELLDPDDVSDTWCD